MRSWKRMFAMAAAALALVGLDAGTARALVDARADVTSVAVKGSTITISIASLLANDVGMNKKFLSIRKYAPQRSSIGFIKIVRGNIIVHINSFAVPDANGFVNLRYFIKAKGGTDSAFVRVPIRRVSPT